MKRGMDYGTGSIMFELRDTDHAQTGDRGIVRHRVSFVASFYRARADLQFMAAHYQTSGLRGLRGGRDDPARHAQGQTIPIRADSISFKTRINKPGKKTHKEKG